MPPYILINPHVKIRWTETSQKEIIQAVHTTTGKPFTLNKKTLNLLTLCDGTKTCQEIIAEFKKGSPDTENQSILKAIQTLVEKNIVLEKESAGKSLNPISHAHLVYPLRVVTWEITNICNLRCLHCYNDAGLHRKQFFSLEEINCIIDKLDKMNVGRISLSGGEPLMHPHFLDIIATLKKRGIPWSLFSNAVLIDEEMAKILVDYGIRKMTTSIDGSTAESHDFLRGVPGSFEKTIHAIKILKGYNIPIEARCALHKKNLRKMPDILALLDSLGIDTYIVAEITSLRPQPLQKTQEAQTPQTHNNAELTITAEDYIKVLPDIIKAEYKIFGRSQCVPDPDPHLKNCGGGASSFLIKPDGTMVPCPFSDPEFFSFGNAVTDNIKKAWDTAKILKKMRTFDFRSIRECSTCKYQIYCNGGCPVKKYKYYNDAFALDSSVCNVMETMEPFFGTPDV
ncbi:MAG: radical SAM protein [Candidatus Methanofastidiosia archaeon]|jgi:radical SAM protein with 4Fe4S-binding SPASM domain